MATAAFNAQGTIIAREGTTPGTYTSIAEIRSFSGPGGSAAIIDATTLQSTGKEKVMGLMDEGQLTLELNLVPGDTGQQALLADRAAQLRKNFRITFSDANNATGTFAAYVMGFTIGGGVDALTTATVTLEITGAVVWDFNPTP
jgi:Lambda phage tail tube protein, TTP